MELVTSCRQNRYIKTSVKSFGNTETAVKIIGTVFTKMLREC